LPTAKRPVAELPLARPEAVSLGSLAALPADPDGTEDYAIGAEDYAIGAAAD